MSNQPKIKKLDETVINRIAAGEIIQRPANALKELIENSLDAKSTNIQITVKDGGLKLLQIQDNGTGINREDFDIVCERFTTSKLEQFEDLQTITTYGFRGEALASISHIAHLTITSKTKTDICAYQGQFVDGKLVSKPKPIAGNQGTIITVEDLFYNMSVRKTVLRSPAEEYQKISDVVGKYAIHNATTGFALRKSNEGNDIRTPPNSTSMENIRIIYGNTIAKELLELEVKNSEFNFKVEGLVSNANYNTKKFTFLLFINHRLVDCQNLKKALDHIYSTYLPKNSHPFVYLSLELDPNTIDVNVHPTKHEVHFLNEDQIIETIVSALEAKLLGSNDSRAFYTQAKLPGVVIENKACLVESEKTHNKSINPKDFVRTDSSMQKLDKFFGAVPRKPFDDSIDSDMDVNISIDEELLNENHQFELDLLNKTVDKEKSPKNRKLDKAKANLISKVTRVDTELTSILELRQSIEENCHRMLRETFAQHVFVGPIDPNQSLIQYSTKLYLCNTKKILEELFYQFVLYNFEHFQRIVFENDMRVSELALLALEQPESGWTPEDGDRNELAQSVNNILIRNAEMLLCYFGLEIDKEGILKSVPILLENYVPDMKELPMYVLRLATEVNWKEEKECFCDFARETARFYAHVPDELDELNRDWKWITEYVIYPAIKDYFIPPKSFTENAAILEIANLPNLYKVFERC